MKKNYEVLRKEHEAGLIEMGRLSKQTQRLAISLSKQNVAETFKKAQKFIHKGVWDGNFLLYIESVKLVKFSILVQGWQLFPGGFLEHFSFLSAPDQHFLNNEPIKETELLEAFIKNTTRSISKFYHSYKEIRDGGSADSNEA